jgi:hypothetical protein
MRVYVYVCIYIYIYIYIYIISIYIYIISYVYHILSFHIHMQASSQNEAAQQLDGALQKANLLAKGDLAAFVHVCARVRSSCNTCVCKYVSYVHIYTHVIHIYKKDA